MPSEGHPVHVPDTPSIPAAPPDTPSIPASTHGFVERNQKGPERTQIKGIIGSFTLGFRKTQNEHLRMWNLNGPEWTRKKGIFGSAKMVIWSGR